ncbi:MAG: putative DNA binding domain-containing protein [Pseudomonadota bacterium]|nr:putative DNA binding domain-containing protein [Pseudomonadota bacterium]
MISKEELAILIKNTESDHLERTESTDDTQKFCEAVCAFANDMPNHRKPGYLLIGVKKDGTLSGLSATEQLLETLGQKLRKNGNILPIPTITIGKFAYPEGDVVAVEVIPSDIPPVRYNNKIYIRTGAMKDVASEQQERVLSERRVSSTLSYDVTPYQGATLDDLALDLFEVYRKGAISADIIEANGRSIEEQLASLRFFDLRMQCPTIAGILLFGKNPRYFLPGAYVQYLRFPGTAITDEPDDQQVVSGDLGSVMRELEIRIKTNLTTHLEKVSTLQEKVYHNYPEVAVRELLNNAVMHRDYRSHTPVRLYWFEDRIEIQNPGALYGEVTLDTIISRNSYRNPVIAETMKTLGYVNRFGYGIQRAKKALNDNGNPEPVLESANSVFLAKIYRRAP